MTGLFQVTEKILFLNHLSLIMWKQMGRNGDLRKICDPYSALLALGKMHFETWNSLTTGTGNWPLLECVTFACHVQRC